MKKYLAYYENEWPVDIAELTAIENKPFVGYLGGTKEVKYTVITAPIELPPDNEIWYTSSDGNVVTPYSTDVFGSNIVSNTYEDGKGVIKFDNSVTSIGDYAFFDCSSLTSIVIPDSVTSIGGGAFSGCSLTSITLPNSVTSIGDQTFQGCSSLTSVTIPNSVTSIEYGAFDMCTSLTSVTIPNSVTSIRNGAFAGCSSLTSITIPNSVTSIEDNAFFDCNALTSITYDGSKEQWNDINKDGRWTFLYVPATYVQCSDGQVAL